MCVRLKSSDGARLIVGVGDSEKQVRGRAALQDIYTALQGRLDVTILHKDHQKEDGDKLA